MRVSFRPNDRFEVHADGTNHKEVFAELAGLAEVFSIDKCGKCGDKDIIPVFRVVDKFKYYECRCKKCRARLSFGQSQTGNTLYPRRHYHEEHPLVKEGKVKEGDFIPHDGWELYVPPADAAAKKGAAKKA